MKRPEKLKRKLTIYILTFLICSFSPVLAWGSSVIKELKFINNPGGKTEIVMEASGGFKYFVYANLNDLIIDIKGARIADNLLKMLNNSSIEENNIEKLKIENISDDFSRVTIGLKDIKNFKFIVKSNKGEAAPYGFNSKAKVAAKIPKLNNQQAKYKPIKENKNIEEDNDLMSANSDADGSIFDDTENENILLRDKVNIKETNVKPLKSADIKETTPKLLADTFDDVDIVVTNVPVSASLNTKIDSSSNKSRRLDEDSITIPENYLMKEITKEESLEAEVEQAVQAVEEEPEVKSPTEPERKPLSSEELMQRLSSNVQSNQDIPRLVPAAKHDKEEPRIQEPEMFVKPEENNSTGLIKNVNPLPKGTPIPINADGISMISPDGSKVIDVASSLNSSGSKTSYQQEDGLSSDLLEPRDLNYMPLGLSETYYYPQQKEDVNLDNLKPKPAYTSDGQMAIKIYSADGVSNKKASVRQIYSKNSGNTVVLNNQTDGGYQSYSGKTGFVDSTFKSMINKANSLYKTGNMLEAEQAYKQAIEYDTEVPWGYIALAGFYESQHSFEKAAEAYAKAAHLLPDKTEIIYNLSLANYKSKRYAEAIENLRDVISLSPNFTLAYYNLGTLYYKMNKIDDSIKYLTKAIQLNPVLTDAHYNLGLAYVLSEKLEEATNSFKLCTSIDPDDSSCERMLSDLK